MATVLPGSLVLLLGVCAHASRPAGGAVSRMRQATRRCHARASWASDDLVLVDALPMLYRSYYALKNTKLTSPSGTDTTAAFGFFRLFSSLIRENRPRRMAVVIDGPYSSLVRKEKARMMQRALEDVLTDARGSAPTSTLPLGLEVLPRVASRMEHVGESALAELAADAKERAPEAEVTGVAEPSRAEAMEVAVGEALSQVAAYCEKAEAVVQAHASSAVPSTPPVERAPGRADEEAVATLEAVQRFPAYKQTRPPMPRPIVESLAVVRDLVEALGIPWVSEPVLEADDVIGSLAHGASREGVNVYIVSADKDFHQLLGPCVRQMRPSADRRRGGYEVLDADWVRAKYNGVGPESFVDLMALVGDAADNVPGVPGVGLKTGSKLIGEWGSLERLLLALPEVKTKPAKLATALRDYAASACLSKQLIAINRAASLSDGRVWEDMVCGPPDLDAVRRILDELNVQDRAVRSGLLGQTGVDSGRPTEVRTSPPPPGASVWPDADDTSLAEDGDEEWVEPDISGAVMQRL